MKHKIAKSLKPHQRNQLQKFQAKDHPIADLQVNQEVSLKDLVKVIAGTKVKIWVQSTNGTYTPLDCKLLLSKEVDKKLGYWFVIDYILTAHNVIHVQQIEHPGINQRLVEVITTLTKK